MNHGLLAPQFGLGRIALPDTATTERPSARNGMPSSDSSATGPTVIFKRRRLLEGAETLVGEASTPSTSPKTPKVYRLAAAASLAAGDAASAQVASLASKAPQTGTSAEQSVTTKLRRRRDPTRQPTLLKHVVVKPPVEPCLSGSPILPSEVGVGDAQAVRDALKELDAALGRVTRAQETFRALDEHLSALGISRSR
jgi:hypothetical protein